MRIETWNRARFLRLHASLRGPLRGFVWETHRTRAVEMYRAANVVAELEFCTQNPDAAGTVELDVDELPPLPIEFCAAYGCQTVMLFPADLEWIIRGATKIGMRSPSVSLHSHGNELPAWRYFMRIQADPISQAAPLGRRAVASNADEEKLIDDPCMGEQIAPPARPRSQDRQHESCMEKLLILGVSSPVQAQTRGGMRARLTMPASVASNHVAEAEGGSR